jgi:glucose-6-phosphate isomerase
MTATHTLSPTQLSAWRQLAELAAQPQPHLRERLQDPQRSAMQAIAEGTGIHLDYSRQAFDGAVWSALQSLAREAQVTAQRDAMFSGQAINTSENRAVLHVALRGTPNARAAAPWGSDIQNLVQDELQRVCDFAERVRSGAVKSSSGAAFTDVVNIGIGGSDLGPRMAADALAPFCSDRLRVHFVSNPDAWALHSTLRGLNPATTLVIVASKTFTTQETMTNAASARRWLADGGIDGAAQSAHLVAVTAAPAKSTAAGYPPEHTFTFWDWVGGRYSVWSALGLPLAMAIGAAAFRDLLAGAQAGHQHGGRHIGHGEDKSTLIGARVKDARAQRVAQLLQCITHCGPYRFGVSRWLDAKTVASKQVIAHRFSQTSQCIAHSGLGHGQPQTGSGETSLNHHLVEDAEQIKIQAAKIANCHNCREYITLPK